VARSRSSTPGGLTAFEELGIVWMPAPIRVDRRARS
jgi:hypothetical protein